MGCGGLAGIWGHRGRPESVAQGEGKCSTGGGGSLECPSGVRWAIGVCAWWGMTTQPSSSQALFPSSLGNVDRERSTWKLKPHALAHRAWSPLPLYLPRGTGTQPGARGALVFPISSLHSALCSTRGVQAAPPITGKSCPIVHGASTIPHKKFCHLEIVLGPVWRGTPWGKWSWGEIGVKLSFWPLESFSSVLWGGAARCHVASQGNPSGPSAHFVILYNVQWYSRVLYAV